MSDQISEKVMSIVASVKQIPPEAVSIHSTFKEPGSDSLDASDIVFEIVFELEDAFNVGIPDEQARSVRSLAEMIDGVRKLTGDDFRSASPRADYTYACSDWPSRALAQK
jgi:acyl carrier protein